MKIKKAIFRFYDDGTFLFTLDDGNEHQSDEICELSLEEMKQIARSLTRQAMQMWALADAEYQKRVNV